MKTRSFIIITGAIVTIVAPAAQANVERLLPSKPAITSHQRIVIQKKAVTKVSKKHVSTGPRYIYFPASAGQPTPAPTYTDQQLCADYAMDCDVIVSSTNDASPAAIAAVEAVETQASDTLSPQSSQVESSASDSSPTDSVSEDDC